MIRNHIDFPAQFAHWHELPQAHLAEHAQAVFAAAFWQPQVQSLPRQGVQAQRFWFDSFMGVSNELRVG